MAKVGKLPEFYSNLTNTVKPSKNTSRITAAHRTAKSMLKELQQQSTTHTKFETKPSASEGAEGDTKLVKDGGRYYSYHKIGKEWFKTELERDDG